MVSEVCLGTMTWGEQNSDEEAHEQLDIAFDKFGVNFVVRGAEGVHKPRRGRRLDGIPRRTGARGNNPQALRYELLFAPSLR